MNYFLAVSLSPEARQIIAEQAGAWNTALSVKPIAALVPRWYESEDYHITLKFLGNLVSPDEDDLRRRGQAAAEKTAAFSVTLNGTGAFPNLARPRVLWVGVEQNADLAALAARIDEELCHSGFKPEKRPYVPHVTVARCRPNQKPVPIPTIKEHMFVIFHVDHFVLMQTLPPESRAKDSKARYNIVHTFPFGRQPEL